MAQQAFDLGAGIAKLVGEVSKTSRPPLQAVVTQQGTPVSLQNQQATPDNTRQGGKPLQGRAYTPNLFDWIFGEPAFAEGTPKTDKPVDTPKKLIPGRVEKRPKDDTPELKPEVAQWVPYLNLFGPQFKSFAAIEDCGAWEEFMKGDSPAISLDDYYAIVAATKVEGTPDSLQGYDDKVLTLGASQKVWDVSGGGELADQIYRFRLEEEQLTRQDPTRVDKYMELFDSNGFVATNQKVDGNGNLVFEKDPKTQKPLMRKGKPVLNRRKQPVMDPKTGDFKLDKNGNKIPVIDRTQLYYKDPATGALKTGRWFKKYIAAMQAKKARSWIPVLKPLQTAGADPSFQRFQIRDLKQRLDKLMARESNGYSLGTWAKGQELRAELLQLSINRPSNVTGVKNFKNAYADFGRGDGVPDSVSNGALEDFIAKYPKAADPTQWTDVERFGDGKKNKGYERELSDMMLKKELRGSHVTDATGRTTKVRNYLKKPPLPKWMREKKK